MKYFRNDEHNLIADEDYWAEIRKGYRLKTDYIILENGYYCFAPESPLKHFLEHVKEDNFQESNYVRTFQWENKDKSDKRMAELAGCGQDEQRTLEMEQARYCSVEYQWSAFINTSGVNFTF